MGEAALGVGVAVLATIIADPLSGPALWWRLAVVVVLGMLGVVILIVDESRTQWAKVLAWCVVTFLIGLLVGLVMRPSESSPSPGYLTITHVGGRHVRAGSLQVGFRETVGGDCRGLAEGARIIIQTRAAGRGQWRVAGYGRVTGQRWSSEGRTSLEVPVGQGQAVEIRARVEKPKGIVAEPTEVLIPRFGSSAGPGL